MAAFAYLNILACRIELLLNDSDDMPNHPSREILQLAQRAVKPVEEIAARMNWKGLRTLEMEISEEAAKLLYRLEGAVQSNFSKLESESTSMELDGLKQEIQCFVDRVKKMEEEYADELYNPLPLQGEEEDKEEDHDASVSNGLELKMVGLSDQYKELKKKLLEATYFVVVPVVGMPGIGKTTLARKVFADPKIVKGFKVRIWVKVGKKCSLKQIPRRILARVDPDSLNQMVEERDIARHLRESLMGKRYLIVLDDVWQKNIVYQLQPSSRYSVNALGDPLPYQENGSCVLVTTRLQQGEDDLKMRLLNKEESWDLLRDKVFGEKSCSSQIERAGKKIAENCEGLPLTIIELAKHLSNIEDWDEVSAKKNHKLFKVVYDQISKVLLPSYNYLPRLLQICFLYIGVFPQNHRIPRSKLVNMWNVDGFLERNENFDALDCLEELVSNSLVMIYQNTTGVGVGLKEIKTCGLHSSLWHFSTTEARKIKFCHVLTSLDDCLDGDMIGQSRLSLHNNILCTIKDVYEFVEENCVSTVRSLFYYGPYHPFQVPICSGLKLLRELDVFTIRFYEFPIEILLLVKLKYLALTLDGKIPPTISELSSLQFFIVGRHFVVIKPHRDRCLPLEIWNMQALEQLQAMASDLPHPPCGASLEKLSTLSNVSSSGCTEEVFRAIPNLEKLGFLIELGPNDDGIPLRCFDHISHLEKLTSLKCVVVNPKVIRPPPPPRGELTNFRSGMKKLSLSKLRWKETSSTSYGEKLRSFKSVVVNLKTVPSLSPGMDLPLSLTKLTLSGLGYHWDEMTLVASLPHLKVLKLRNYAFRGSDWRVKKLGFPSLQSLVIEDSDIVEWRFGRECFKCLERLTLKHCYKYERMVGRFGSSIRKIGLVDCNINGVLQMQEVVPFPWIEWKCHFSVLGRETETH